MAFINRIGSFILGVTPISQPTGVWEQIIMAFHAGIVNYGWAIIIFTLVLKIIMSPLDFFNRRVSEKNTRLQKIMQPEIAKIQKQYGNNRQMINQKTMEIYKKHNYNLTSSCLTMVLNLGLTLFIFITLFGGLNSMASYKVGYQYQQMEITYNQVAYGEEGVETDFEKYLAKYEEVYNYELQALLEEGQTPEDATEDQKELASEAASIAAEAFVGEGKTLESILAEIDAAVLETYNEVKESWLWVRNVWRPDTPWKKAIPNFDEFVSMAGISYKDSLGEGESETFKIRLSSNKSEDRVTYENIMLAIESENGPNGYLIIPILAVALTILSMLATQGKLKFMKKKTDEKVEDKTVPNPMSGWFMFVLLGGLMGYITIIYNSIFALYILTSSLFGFATAPLISLLIRKSNTWQENRKSKKVEVNVPYKRK